MLAIADLHAPRQRQRRRTPQRRLRLLLPNAIVFPLQRKFGTFQEIIWRRRLPELQCLMLVSGQPSRITILRRGTNQVGKRNVRRVGGQLVEFLFAQFQHYYYFGRNGVDDNNRERQGLLSFEDVYLPRD